MRLLVDCIPYDGGKSGISVYIREVVRALAQKGHELTLLVEPDVPEADFVGFRLLRAPRWTVRPILSMLWHLYALPRVADARRFDAQIVLAANRRMPGSVRLPTVAVVHDLSQYHVPAKYGLLRMFYVKRLLPRYVRRAHRVVAISQSTAKDLVTHWHVPEKKIAVVYNGFTPPPFANAHRPGTPGPILYVSRIEHPGKNHVNLIRAYEKLPRPLAGRHPLVLVGKDWPGAEAVHEAREKSVFADLITLTGFVDDGRLAGLWREAALCVFPSRYEGFGLSLLEAMSAGVPCAASRTSSLGELGAGVAALFDPESPDEIADAMRSLLTADPAGRIAAGRKRAGAFSWKACADGILGAFPPASVFGVPIHTDTMAEALALIRRTKAPARRFFAFVNAHCLNVACRDADYAAILRRCDRVWPDGTGVRLAGRRLGFPVPENVNGTDLFPLLEGRVFLYGAAPGVAERAAENVSRQYPKIEIVGTEHGFGTTEEAIAKINAARPDILLVALGVPRQEKWIAANLPRLEVGCAIAVGGLLDFVSGRIPRAPLFMRRLGVEWVFRFIQEPRRMFRRYVLGNPLFLWRLRRAARKEGL